MFTGDLVTLGATITNPDGTNPADYTYVWSQVSGRTTTLSSTTAANPTYTVPSSGASTDDDRVHERHGRDVGHVGELPAVPGDRDQDQHDQGVGRRHRWRRTPARCRPDRSPTPVRPRT